MTAAATRRAALAALAASAAHGPAQAGDLPDADARLLRLLNDARRADDDFAAACGASEDMQDDPAVDAAVARLDRAIAAMSETPAATMIGASAKMARILRSLRQNGPIGEWGDNIADKERPLAASLGADLARLAPAVRA
ncbi:hypothetical protein [Falsiroseomonas sp.]|uniref:hypothetical protein n=1 Tax=Falsiroseomonas sp. TaxID=2870721 RepID=UPI00272076C0|nr:hypothetical protein [Falsiroseomonas sp.]MDO9502151.1 hypothetical protein [Falsiroseomonas sp.]